MHETDDPAEGQTLEAIEKYLRNAQENDEVAIRNTHGGILSFKIAKVTGTKPSSGRLYTDTSGLTGGTAWYMKHGKNAFHPTGQSRLFVPTEKVRSFIENNPTGVMTYKTYTPG